MLYAFGLPLVSLFVLIGQSDSVVSGSTLKHGLNAKMASP